VQAASSGSKTFAGNVVHIFCELFTEFQIYGIVGKVDDTDVSWFYL